MEKIIVKIKDGSKLVCGNMLMSGALVLLLFLLAANVHAAVVIYQNSGWTGKVFDHCLYALCNAGWILVGWLYMKGTALVRAAVSIIKIQQDFIDELVEVIASRVVPARPDGNPDGSSSGDGSSSDDGGSSDDSSSDDGGSSDDSSSDDNSSDDNSSDNGSSSDDGSSSEDSSSDNDSSSDDSSSDGLDGPKIIPGNK